MRQAISEALSLLNARDRRLLRVSVIVQMGTSLLDLIGVVLIGLVGALAVATVQSQPVPAQFQTALNSLGFGDVNGQQLVAGLAVAAAITLLTKSVVSSVLNRRVFKFLANRQALVSARLAKALLSQPLTYIQRRTSQETAFALIQGAGAATVTILGQSVVALTEISVLVVLSAALALVDPLLTFGCIAYFAVVALVLQRAMGKWASRIGKESVTADILSLNAIQEAMAAYREITVADRRELYVNRIQDLRWRAASVGADLQFIGMFPKYMFEAALVLGGVLLAGFLFTTQDSVAAVGILTLFLAAATRVMPSLLRLQGAALLLRSSAGVAGPTFALAQELDRPLETPAPPQQFQQIRSRMLAGHPGFHPTISVEEVSFGYPGASHNALNGVSLHVEAGQSLALVGSSGSGKSTLADVILGLLTPDEGSVRVGGVMPLEAVRTWPGGIAYVPQEVLLADGTVRSNVALGLPLEAIDDDLVWEALRRANLDAYLVDQRQGLETPVGEGGLRLSGGQRQRLGVARALYTRPKLLVLDEATSSLDAATEQDITRTVEQLEGQVTTVIIAHRLSTIRNVDLVAYLDRGSVRAIGPFGAVRKAVPEFDRQAQLMGL